MVLFLHSLPRFAREFDLVFKGQGNYNIDDDRDNVAEYIPGDVVSGTVPVAGDFVVWCFQCITSGGNPIDGDTTGWATATTGNANDKYGIFAKKLTAGDLSSPLVIQDNGSNASGIAMWVAFSIVGEMMSVADGSANFSGNATAGTPTTVNIDSTAAAGHDDIALMFGSARGTSGLGMLPPDISPLAYDYTRVGSNVGETTADMALGLYVVKDGANINFVGRDQGDGNSSGAGYVVAKARM